MLRSTASAADLPPIYMVGGQRIVLDRDLAVLFGVTTTAFNQAIRRNLRRFPPDFIFEISHEERASLISQIVTSNAASTVLRSQAVTRKGRGGYRKPALAFTEHGAIMAATILRSDGAVAMSVYVVRAFIRIREELATGAVIFKRLAEIDKKLLTHDIVLRDIYRKLAPLLSPPADLPRHRIGFHQGNR